MDSGILMIQDSILVCSPDPSIPHTADVGTSNALVLYNESVKIGLPQTAQHTPMNMNIAQLKMKLVEDLVGRSIDNLFESGGKQGSRAAHPSPHCRWGMAAVCILCFNV
jgi:hypothetical protein